MRCTAQQIELYEQFAGRYDFLFFGNTLNQGENGTGLPCTINTSSSATLALGTDDILLAAYLYWAGSGSEYPEISLNGQTIAPERTFALNFSDRDYFSAFANVTTLVEQQGNGTYTVANFDLTDIINGDTSDNLYCSNATNFGGWAIVVIYENNNLPLNQLNIYDGLQNVPDEVNITLPNLNVIDNQGAKIGFLAWEGDKSLAINETLRINNNILSNPPLNPANNAFNGTNSFTGSDTLYNMDLDVYDIQNYIAAGDTSAEIQLTSGRDFVMINAIITKLNSQLPNATVTAENITRDCRENKLVFNYTVYNTNSTDVLPAGIPVAIYLDGVLLATTQTQNALAIGESEQGTITINIPADYAIEGEITFVADDTGNGTGIVLETDENDNAYTLITNLLFLPEAVQPEDITVCLDAEGIALFDFSAYEQSLKNNDYETVTFYLSDEDARAANNRIYNTGSFAADENPQQIFVRLDNGSCFVTTSFLLISKKCPPVVYNYVTPNGDGYNDTFYIEGLRNIFPNFKISIYNRWGNLIWQGNNDVEDWDCVSSEQKVGASGTMVPTGTYYYVLELNDTDFPEPIAGWVYVTK
ncbi:T9SS type B sorting domain-containing protein [Flavobacterium rhizosphaerae]